MANREFPEQHPGECIREVGSMIGDQIGESKGRRTARRVLSTDPPTAEVSFEDKGTLLGVATTGMGSYTSVVAPDGSLHGTGQGMEMTADGDTATWTGHEGAVSYRGMLFFRSASPKFARINNGCAAFEYDVDAAGNTTSKLWEWK